MERHKRYKRTFLGLVVLSLLFLGGCATSAKEIPDSPPPALEESEVVDPPFQASQKISLLDISLADSPPARPVGFHHQEVPSDEIIDPAVEKERVVLPLLAEISSPMLAKESVPPILPEEAGETPLDKTEPLTLPSPKQSALVVSAIGSGLSEAEARSDALASLSSILYSQVSSFVETTKKESELAGVIVGNRSFFLEEIKVSSDLPLLGVSNTVLGTSYDSKHKAFVYEVEAVMKASTSLPLYESELKDFAAKITLVEANLPQAKDSLAKEKQLNLLLGYYTEFEKLGYVARALGATALPSLSRSRYSLELLLMEEGRVIDSYEKAALNLTKAVSKDGAYVYPAKLNGSGGVTEFAEQLAYAMQTELGAKAASDASRAKYYLFGTYTLKTEGKEGIYVTYRLEDREGSVVSTSMAELLPSVYEGQEIVPIAYDFQKQLERGNAVDTGFSVDIRMNGKKDYLSFHTGDELTIEVKASAPCYFYVVGYVFNELDEKFSYLFPLKLDAVGKDMFVYRVSPEDVNKWIIINPTYRGEVLPIEIIEPYGVEMLQVYASTQKEYQKFLETVPGFMETEEYYMISDNPEDGLALTRALNVKKKSEQATSETRQGEASVAFTSSRTR